MKATNNVGVCLKNDDNHIVGFIGALDYTWEGKTIVNLSCGIIDSSLRGKGYASSFFRYAFSLGDVILDLSPTAQVHAMLLKHISGLKQNTDYQLWIRPKRKKTRLFSSIDKNDVLACLPDWFAKVYDDNAKYQVHFIKISDGENDCVFAYYTFSRYCVKGFEIIYCSHKAFFERYFSGVISEINKTEHEPNFKFVHENIINRNKIYQLFAKEHFDYVINFAAESHVDRSVTNPGIFVHTNVVGTQVLLDACRKYGIKRFHQVSTDEVYGDLPIEATNEYFTETSPIKPSSPYSASKASADFLVLAYHRTFHLPVTISRCSNNYGPYQFPEKLIPLMIQRAEDNQTLPVYGTGENIRDWLYVEDHCDAIDLIVRHGYQSIPSLKNQYLDHLM